MFAVALSEHRKPCNHGDGRSGLCGVRHSNGCPLAPILHAETRRGKTLVEEVHGFVPTVVFTTNQGNTSLIGTSEAPFPKSTSHRKGCCTVRTLAAPADAWPWDPGMTQSPA